jgi:hypothetical protein
LLLACVLILLGCSHSVEQYAGQQPELDMQEFFSGHLVAHGLLKSRSGKITRRFTATIDARWDGDEGLLDEYFLFDDGQEQRRCWRLTTDGSQISGTAGDVVGTARGQVVGSTLHWVYQLTVPVDGRDWELTLDDWLVQIDDTTLINTTDLKKWGFTVAELVLSIRKVEDAPIGEFDFCAKGG